MAGETDWKMKYQELKARYMNDVDVAFRLGVEEGVKQAGVDNANQQLMQAQNQQNNAPKAPPTPEGGKPNNNDAMGTPNQGSAPDKSGAPSVQPEPVQPVSEHPDGSELTQQIAKLETLVAKSENLDVDSLKKTIDDIKSLQKAYRQEVELRKSAAAIPNIVKALHKPEFKFGIQAQHNLNNTAKSAATMQHKIVNDVMQKMEDEEKKAKKDILSTLNVEGILKD